MDSRTKNRNRERRGSQTVVGALVINLYPTTQSELYQPGRPTMTTRAIREDQRLVNYACAKNGVILARDYAWNAWEKGLERTWAVAWWMLSLRYYAALNRIWTELSSSRYGLPQSPTRGCGVNNCMTAESIGKTITNNGQENIQTGIKCWWETSKDEVQTMVEMPAMPFTQQRAINCRQTADYASWSEEDRRCRITT